MNAEIRRSMVLQVGDHDGGKVLVAISQAVSLGEHSKSRVIGGAVYDDHAAAWRAVRDFATSRLLEGAEELVERVSAPPSEPAQQGDAPF